MLFPPSDESPAPEETPASESSAFDWRGTGTVLVIDDEDAVNQIARRIFERQGFSTLGAADGFEGIRLFHQHDADVVLVLVDKTMGGFREPRSPTKSRGSAPTYRSC